MAISFSVPACTADSTSSALWSCNTPILPRRSAVTWHRNSQTQNAMPLFRRPWAASSLDKKLAEPSVSATFSLRNRMGSWSYDVDLRFCLASDTSWLKMSLPGARKFKRQSKSSKILVLKLWLWAAWLTGAAVDRRILDANSSVWLSSTWRRSSLTGFLLTSRRFRWTDLEASKRKFVCLVGFYERFWVRRTSGRSSGSALLWKR